MPLGPRVSHMAGAHSFHPLQDGWVPSGRVPEVGPVAPLSAGDDVVDRGQGEPAVIEVAVAHGSRESEGAASCRIEI